MLSCAETKCNEHPKNPKIVIDGPGLAYYIYFRVLAYKSSCMENIAAIPSIDVIPSYDELGKATLVFLDELRSRGAVMYILQPFLANSLEC